MRGVGSFVFSLWWPRSALKTASSTAAAMAEVRRDSILALVGFYDGGVHIGYEGVVAWYVSGTSVAAFAFALCTRTFSWQRSRVLCGNGNKVRK